jgi:phage recombination protein Bet
MATQIVPQPQAKLVEKMATQYGLEPAKFMGIITKTIMPAGVAMEHVAAFLVVANQYQLNPLTKEIYAFPNRGGVVPIVSVDGWATIINRQPNLDGIEFEDHLEEAHLVSITCRIYRKDRARPVEVTEYMAECRRDTEPWKKWPARMLRHKALVQCARYAFALTGIYDPDEAERIAETTPKAERLTEAARLASDSAMAQLKEKYVVEPEHIEAEVVSENPQSDVETQAEPLRPHHRVRSSRQSETPEAQTSTSSSGEPQGEELDWQ